jgi:uncharacterized membrane protein
MAKNADRVTYPGDYIFFGVIPEILGGALLGAGLLSDVPPMTVIGSVVASIGGLILLVGVVGQGVLVGLRAHRSELYEQPADD